ncbi:unnamed protein product [Rotaria sp. Silwood1]|nr:unnamed protein product [Rotaria sp. Silwood1]CAF1633073.1 unnamed protein product [Rotaria sp. Silwood1]CAF3756122.1 unnamed protein product [Rotaria sp. Silwood1]CAF3864257.1 unnamed protein product [Rotaria sp. Silwood1]CAF5022686.1 unnamed protein product [Rotaria sp. Silwood1]
MGTIGNLFNIVLFTRDYVWRQSACIPYLLGSSIASVIVIYTATLTRMLLGFNIMLLASNRILCKTIVYIAGTSNGCTTWFMIGACFDRYISSSSVVTTRHISNMRTTRRIMAITTIVMLITYAEIFYCYESGNTMTIAPCANKNDICGNLDIALTFIVQLIPPFLLIMYFGMGTFFNIRKSSRLHRVEVSSVVSSISLATRRAKMANERAILRVVFIQVVIFWLCQLPYTAVKIYQLLTITTVKNNVRRSIENLVINMSILMYVLDKTYSFYIYTLSSGYYRKQLKRLIGSVFRKARIIPVN